MHPMLRPVTVICGHYGTGKTNLALNAAAMAAREGARTALIDLDLVNPYFRSSDHIAALTALGVTMIPPVFAGTTLDVPAIPPQVAAVLAGDFERLIVDLGGDDAGGTVMGSLGEHSPADAAVLCVINRFRPMVADPAGALAVLHEIEAASGLSVTGLVNNSHLGRDTAATDILDGVRYAAEIADACALPLLANTVPPNLWADPTLSALPCPFPIEILVTTPW